MDPLGPTAWSVRSVRKFQIPFWYPQYTQKSEHLEENTLSTHFIKWIDLNTLFVCTYFPTTLPSQTPLSTRKFGQAGYSTFSSSCPPPGIWVGKFYRWIPNYPSWASHDRFFFSEEMYFFLAFLVCHCTLRRNSSPHCILSSLSAFCQSSMEWTSYANAGGFPFTGLDIYWLHCLNAADSGDFPFTGRQSQLSPLS